MASTTSATAYNIATLITGATPRNVQKDFTRLNLARAPLVGYFGYSKAEKLGEGSKLEWVKARAAARTITNTANIVTADTSITLSTTDAANVAVDQVLLADSELLRVITAGTTTLGITKGLSGTTTTTHTTSTVIQILSPAMVDGEQFNLSPNIRGEVEYNYPQLISYKYAETGLRAGHMGSYLTGGQDDLEYTIANDHKLNAVVQLERSILYSARQQPTGTVAGTFGGLLGYITTNVTASVGVLTATVIEDTLDSIFAWNSDVNVTMIGNRKMHRVFSAVMNQYFNRNGDMHTTEVGVAIDSYASSLATIHFMDVDAMPDGTLLFVRKNDIKLVPIDMGPFGSGWQSFTRGVAETNAVQIEKGFYLAVSLKIGDERQHGKLTGITTTGASYAGFV